MSLLKKLKKRLNPKNLLKNLKKDFKGFMKGFAKAMQNKWVQGIMLVVSLVVPVVGMATAGWAQAAAQGAGFLGKVGGALSNVARGVASMVVNAVTAPVKMALNAGAKGAGMLNANGLASTLSNAGKMVGNASTSLFGNVKMDDLGQIIGRWNGAADGAAKSAGAVADTAAGMGTGGAADQAAGVVGGAAESAGAVQSGGQFGDLATKVSAEGNLIGSAAQTANTSTPGIVGKTLGLIKDNPEVAKMAFQAISSAASPDEAELMEKQYKLQNKWRQEENKAWDSFDPNANQQASDAMQQYSSAATVQQPATWRDRANAARQFVAAPLLKRTYAGAYQ
jgi:hypothetical protein